MISPRPTEESQLQYLEHLLPSFSIDLGISMLFPSHILTSSASLDGINATHLTLL